MSKYKKAKKARRPNIPMYTGPVAGTGSGAGSGAETSAARPETTSVQFDYTHIKKDLTRIFTLAGLFIAALVALSFVLR